MEVAPSLLILKNLKENPNLRTIKTWLDYEQKDLQSKFRVVNKIEDLKYIQGQLRIIDELLDALKKAIS